MQASLGPSTREWQASVTLESEEALHLEVLQQGVDVRVEVRDPSGRRMLVVDGPNGTRGIEILWIVAEERGRHRIEIEATDGKGSFQIRIVSRGPASQEDRWRFEALSSVARGDLLRAAAGDRSQRAAERNYRSAIALWRRLGDPVQEAVGWVRLGQLAGRSGDREKQVRNFERALRLLGPRGHGAQRGYAYLRLGNTRLADTDPEAAFSAFQEALRLAQEVQDRAQEATALNNIALLYERSGALERSVELLGDAVERYREAGHEEWMAQAMTNRAVSLMLLGRLREARETLLEMEQLYRQLRNDSARSHALMHLGWIAYLEKDWKRAHLRYESALEISRAGGLREQEASLLDRRGTLLRAQGQMHDAREDFETALEIFRSLDHRLSVAHTEANLGLLSLEVGRTKEALALQQSALTQFQADRDRHGEAGAHYLGARIARKRGDLHRAIRHMEKLLGIMESQRATVERESSRVAFLDLRFEYYEHYIDLLMALEEEEPGRGHAAAALEAVERSRSRSLLDGLMSSGAQRKVLGPVSARQIQQEMLDAGTVLLVYSLGRSRSFVWIVTSNSIQVRTLAPAAEIERLATSLHRTLSFGASPEADLQGTLAARALSEQILAPLQGSLGEARKILVMGDGALHLVPFGLLPLPKDDKLLLQRHEVVSIPSSSVVLALRRREPRHSRGIAVLADPPFTVADPRVPSRGADLIPTVGFIELQRLPYSRLEAEAVLALSGIREPAFKALGLAAQKDLVTGGDLDNFRILHFATHGVLHTAHPELSGIALSMFAADGTPVDGTLRVRDVVDLDLQAELVVLSGCQTALGQRFKGEGVLGFPRAFMLAGVPTILVSLWKVNDQAAAELMRTFYQGLLEQNRSPSEALVRAQEKLAADPRWRSPHHWAAFVLHGEGPTPPHSRAASTNLLEEGS